MESGWDLVCAYAKSTVARKAADHPPLESGMTSLPATTNVSRPARGAVRGRGLTSATNALGGYPILESGRSRVEHAGLRGSPRDREHSLSWFMCAVSGEANSCLPTGLAARATGGQRSSYMMTENACFRSLMTLRVVLQPQTVHIYPRECPIRGRPRDFEPGLFLYTKRLRRA